jgi:hypothetical protein
VDEKPVTHDEALELIDAHIGERCYMGLHVERVDGAHEEPRAMVFGIVAKLENDLAPKPARTSPGVGAYCCGSQPFHLPQMKGTSIVLRDNGLDFRMGDNVSLRIAWRPSSEVGWSRNDEALSPTP